MDDRTLKAPAGEQIDFDRALEVVVESKLDDITVRTIQIIADYSTLETAQISADTELDELGITSLELTEVVMDLEELYDIEVDLNTAEAWETLKNVGDVVKAVSELVSAKT